MQTITKQKSAVATKIGYIAISGLAIGFFAGVGTYYTNQSISGVNNNVQCNALTETQCIDTISRCQPVFDSQSAFVACKSLTDEQMAQRQQEEALCSQTQGQYVISRYGPYCDCSSNGAVFQRGKGCS